MKTISIMVPTYNEEENVRPLSQAIIALFDDELKGYDYELLFIDNYSKDKTRPILRELCSENPKIRAIFNANNFGQFNSPFYGLCQTTGDCAIAICADFQDPIELLPVFVREWEAGHKVVCGIKASSRENRVMRFFRTCYYKIIHKLSPVEQIEHFTGFGLYDRSFIDTLRTLNDPMPFLRGIVAEYAPDRKEVPYEQQKRRAGKTHNNWYTLYDAAMLSFTSYTKVGLRAAVFAGVIIGFASFLIGIIYLIMKLCMWDTFLAGQAPLIIGIFFLGGIQLFFVGLLGEYIMSINNRVIHRPLVIEQERLNCGGSAPAHRTAYAEHGGETERMSGELGGEAVSG